MKWNLEDQRTLKLQKRTADLHKRCAWASVKTAGAIEIDWQHRKLDVRAGISSSPEFVLNIDETINGSLPSMFNAWQPIKTWNSDGGKNWFPCFRSSEFRSLAEAIPLRPWAGAGAGKAKWWEKPAQGSKIQRAQHKAICSVMMKWTPRVPLAVYPKFTNPRQPQYPQYRHTYHLQIQGEKSRIDQTAERLRNQLYTIQTIPGCYAPIWLVFRLLSNHMKPACYPFQQAGEGTVHCRGIQTGIWRFSYW